jgi:hypothetical protein
MTTAVILTVFFALHIVTTVCVVKWAVKETRAEISSALGELRDLLPPHVRTMLGIDTDRERVDV